MPRSSPFTIILTLQEQRGLERIVRSYSSPYSLVIRAKIALHAAAGLTNKDIGERLDIPRQVVSKWRKRFFEERLAGLEERPRSGRPKVSTRRDRGKPEGRNRVVSDGT